MRCRRASVSPTQVYLLAVVFRFVPPSILVARIFSAFWVFAACLLLGLLAVATYQKTIQTAFREVSDALARQGTVNQLVAARQMQKESAADAFVLSEARYREGIDPFLDALDAQRNYYTAQRAFALGRLTAALNQVELYRALGGDSLYPVSLAATAGR